MILNKTAEKCLEDAKKLPDWHVMFDRMSDVVWEQMVCPQPLKSIVIVSERLSQESKDRGNKSPWTYHAVGWQMILNMVASKMQTYKFSGKTISDSGAEINQSGELKSHEI